MIYDTIIYNINLMEVKAKVNPRFVNQIPDEILNDTKLKALVSYLPKNYNFEIYKSVHRIKSIGKPQANIFLQFPEGLLLYACMISDIL